MNPTDRVEVHSLEGNQSKDGAPAARSGVSRGWVVLIGLGVVFAITMSARGLPLIDWLEGLAESIRSLGMLGVLVYALLYAGAAMLCLPCMPLTIAGGFILGTGAGVAAVHTGTCLAAAGGFLLGRAAGRAHLADRLRRSERFHFIEGAVAREGWKIVGLLRMHAIPFGLSNYIYGMTAVPFWHYFAATALAMLPGNIVFVHLGAIGGRKLSGQEGMHPLEIALLGLGFVSLIALSKVVVRIVRTHRTSQPLAKPGATESKE